jgi:hypothetical protein
MVISKNLSNNYDLFHVVSLLEFVIVVDEIDRTFKYIKNRYADVQTKVYDFDELSLHINYINMMVDDYLNKRGNIQLLNYKHMVEKMGTIT